jgi:pilus assembly protein CpaE
MTNRPIADEDEFWLDDPMSPPAAARRVAESFHASAAGLDEFPDVHVEDPDTFDVPPPPFDDSIDQPRWAEDPGEPMPSAAPGPAAAGIEPAPSPLAWHEDDMNADAAYWQPPGGSARSEPALGGEQPVPAIAIHAFCDRAELMEVIRASKTDRRLAKANLTVSPGGIEAAVRHFATEPSPNLLILDSKLGHHALLAQLELLAGNVDPGTRVIVIGAQDNIQLYKDLIRSGVSEYLVPPLPPLDLIKCISGLYVDPEKPFVGREIAFIGAKGGVGSSTVAHNIAWLIAERFEANTTLVDLDLSFGTVGLDFNLDSEQGILDALRTPGRVDDVVLERLLTRHSEHLTLFTAPGSLVAADFAPDAFDAVLSQVRRGVPFVALDVPNQWTPWVQDTLKNADDVVITAMPDLASLRGAKQMVDFVRAARPNDRPPILVLNQVGVPKKPEIPAKEFANHVGVEPSLILPFDPALFVGAAHNGQMVAEIAAGTKVSEGFDDLARLISGRTPVERKTSLIERVRAKLIGR